MCRHVPADQDGGFVAVLHVAMRIGPRVALSLFLSRSEDIALFQLPIGLLFAFRVCTICRRARRLHHGVQTFVGCADSA
jgi:hypothetical protein